MMMRELAVEILNSAKNCKDSKSKVFQLEQIKEIVLHRQRDLLPVLLSDVFDFVTDKSAPVRKFLITLSGDLFRQEPGLVLPKMLELFSFVMSDSNDSVLAAVAKELAKSYAKIVLFIVSLSESGSQELWASLRALLNKLLDHIASARSDYLKLWCIRLLEEQIVFAIPNAAPAVDPRLQRKDPRLGRAMQKDASSASAASAAASADSIPLHHTVVSRTALQKDAEDALQRVTQWLARGGPQNYPLSASLLSSLAQLLASVGTLRPAQSLASARAITQFLAEKSAVVAQMETADLEGLARAATRLLKAAVHTADPEGLLGRLKAAVNSLSISSSAAESTETQAQTVGKKRAAGELSTGGDEEEEDVESEAYRGSVLSALNAAELSRREQMERATAAAHSLFQAKPATTTESLEHVPRAECTELCADVLSVDSAALKFNATLVRVEEKTLNGAREQCFSAAATPPKSREYSDLALFSLLKLLENYTQLVSLGAHAIQTYKEVLTRTVLSLVVTSLEDEAQTQVRIISSWSNALEEAQTQDIPAFVSLSRGLWLFASFTLQTSEGMDALGIDPDEDIRQKVEILTKFCNELLVCAENNDHNESGARALHAVYESITIAILSRMLQISYLRAHCKDFLLFLRKIPPACLSLLRVLVVSGTKSTSSTRDKESGGATRYRGTRADALSLLGQLVFAEDFEVATDCLQYLLWSSLDDSFELRSRIIDVLIHEIVPANDWCNETIFQFAIQSMATAVSAQRVLDFEATRSLSAMDVDTSPEEEGEGESYALSLRGAMCEELYDGGRRFNGDFSACLRGSLSEDLPKAAHLFNQLCLVECALLPVYLELFCATAGTRKTEEDEKNEQLLLNLLKEALKPIVPAMLRAHKDVELFSLISRVSDRSARPLVAFVLSLLHGDMVQPAKPALIEKVFRFVGGELPVAASGESVSGAEETTLSALSALPLSSLESDEDFRLFLPLVSGLSAAVIEQNLPRIVRMLSDDMDALETVFARIIRARPPPMTKAGLLVALHRINLEQHELKTKTLTQAIAICLKNQSEFSSAVMKEALQTLMQDDVPHIALMRTALLSASNFSEIKRFVLTELIPALARRSVWSSAPKVWEGVLVGADNLTTGNVSSKWVEPTLRALLSIPGSNLKAVLKLTKTLKKTLAKYLQSLSPQEREDALCGRTQPQTDTESMPAASSEQTMDADKKKIVKDLLALAAPPPART